MDNTVVIKLYLGLIVAEFISLLFGLDFLHIISNVLTAPLIIFLYLKIIKHNYKWYFIAIILALYATDIFHLIAVPDLNNLFCIYLNAIAYSILSFFIFRNMEFKKLKELDFIFYLSFAIVFFFYLYILYVVNSILIEQQVTHYIAYVIYAVLMFLMSILITIKYILKPNISNTSLQIAIACFIVSDFFYLISLIYEEIIMFKYLFLVPRLVLYYFLLKYELNRNKIFEII